MACHKLCWAGLNVLSERHPRFPNSLTSSEDFVSTLIFYRRGERFALAAAI